MDLFKNLITCSMHGQLSKLDAFYQRHAGQECYLFGNGVSLKWMDLGQFSDRHSIVGNAMLFHRDFKALKVPYYSVIEPFWFWPFFPATTGGKLEIIRNHISPAYHTFISRNPGTRFFINFSNYPVARYPNAVYVSRFYEPPFKERNLFADREDTHQGTLRFQIALAIFLGFKKAYLVGQDYTHFPSKSGHFYEKGEGVPNGTRDFCKEFLVRAKQDIDLVTVTLDAGSETLDHITYKELTGKEPCFRENLDIVERVNLERLATWKWFVIF